MRNIFIPIKNNSNRVPKKNFRKFGKKTLYEHTLDKLKEFSVFIDTDSEILKDDLLAKYDNVKVQLRDEKLIGDEISVCDIMTSAIKNFEIKGNLLQMHVTSPFINVKTIKKVFEVMETNEFDSVVSCNFIQSRLWRFDNNILTPVNHNPAKLEQTQDLAKLYEENSGFYMIDVDSFMKTNMRVGTNVHFYNLKFPENLDIDTEDDWNFCCKVLEIIK